MRDHIVIAVDGPSSAGKSSVARALAAKLKITYVDTGALYRAIGLYVCRKGIGKDDRTAIERALPDAHIVLRYEDGAQRVFLNGEDVSDAIRTQEIASYASKVSAIPAVRRRLLSLQRGFARDGSVVMDGRDIGTVILPDATLKVFLTASAEERAKRRTLDLTQRGLAPDFDTVLKEIRERDFDDSTRAEAPLKMAEGAVLIDSTTLAFDEVIERVLQMLEQKTSGRDAM